jgi:hypothetical protein
VRALTRAAFAITFVAAFASADAPPDQYGPFNSQAQDIVDNYARLDWQRFLTLPPQMVDYNGALLACDKPARLPTYRELLTLVDENPHDAWDPDSGTKSARYIDPNAFPDTPAGPYWSMSPGSTQGTIKVVDFADGMSKDSAQITDPKTLGWVRCVIDKVP